MKNSGKIIGVFILLLVSGKGPLNAQGGTTDTTRMNRQRMHHMEMSDMHRMRGMSHNTDSMMMGGMRHRSDTMYMRGMRPHMYKGWGLMGPMDHFGPGHFGVERLRIESIPNLTDKQKIEIFNLRQKHLIDMKKFRDEMTTKIQSMREAHRKDILNLLTDEQKKFLESGSDKSNTGSSKQK